MDLFGFKLKCLQAFDVELDWVNEPFRARIILATFGEFYMLLNGQLYIEFHSQNNC